jgi:hypothetical protein
MLRCGGSDTDSERIPLCAHNCFRFSVVISKPRIVGFSQVAQTSERGRFLDAEPNEKTSCAPVNCRRGRAACVPGRDRRMQVRDRVSHAGDGGEAALPPRTAFAALAPALRSSAGAAVLTAASNARPTICSHHGATRLDSEHVRGVCKGHGCQRATTGDQVNTSNLRACTRQRWRSPKNMHARRRQRLAASR